MEYTTSLMSPETGVFANMKQSLGDILRPTKGEESYTKIAIRANEWIRKQIDSGRDLNIKHMSSEQVRRIFENITFNPAMIYIEALAAVQHVPLNSLLEAAGYPVPSHPNPASLITDDLRARFKQSLRGKGSNISEKGIKAAEESFDEIMEEVSNKLSKQP